MLLSVDDPYLDAGLRGHIVKLAKRNVHKLSAYDMEDLIQEGYLCFSLVKARYVGKRPKRRPDGTYRRSLPAKRPDATAKKHFMRLFQRTFHNRIVTLGRKQSKLRELLLNDLIPPEQSEISAWDQLLPAEEEQATVLQLLRGAPQEIKQLFALMVDDVIRPYRRSPQRRGPRETTNQYYCRILGLPSGRDLTAEVQRYFVG